MTQVNELNSISLQFNPESWIDRNFAAITFTISTLALLILAPLATLLGAALSYSIQVIREPKISAKMVTSQNAVIAIVGALAAALRFTPAGAAGSFIFRSIPFLSTYAIGDTLYRATTHSNYLQFKFFW